MIELTTNFFCLTRTQRTQGSGRPLGRDYYSRRGEAGAASRRLARDSLWSVWPPRAPPPHAPGQGRRGCRAPSALQLVARVVSIRLRLDGLAGRRGVGRVGHGGQAMGQGHGAGDNAFYSGWDATGGHAHHARGVPAGRGGRAGEAGRRGTLGQALSRGCSSECGWEGRGCREDPTLALPPPPTDPEPCSQCGLHPDGLLPTRP